jgi:hypothetical protein
MARGPALRCPVHCSTVDSTVASGRGSPELGRSRPRRLAVRRGKEGRCHRESNLANTEAWKAMRGRLTGDRVSARKGGGEGMVGAKRRSAGGVGVFTEGGAAFHRAEARRGRSGAFNG